MSATTSKNYIFISYSRKDADRARQLSTALEHAGYDVWVDTNKLRHSEIFPIEIENALSDCKKVFVIWSEASQTSEWVRSEATYAAYLGKVVGICADGAEIPVPFNLLSSPALLEVCESDSLLRDLIESCPDNQAKILPKPSIDRSRLPKGADHFVGRQMQLDTLGEAVIANRILPDAKIVRASKKLNLCHVYTSGGGGKTSLLHQLLTMLQDSNAWWGINKVFCWSFYGQATTQERTASSDFFFDAAFKHFDIHEPPFSPWEKGVELARVIGDRQALLLLDGIEPLQHPPGALRGALRDEALRAFLSCLANHNEGLCITTGRQAIAELSSAEYPAYLPLELQNLSSSEGTQLLQAIGVHSKNSLRLDEEFSTVVIEYHGHPLALSLLGNLLVHSYDGDIVNAHRVRKLADNTSEGYHAHRVLQAYEDWFRADVDLSSSDVGSLHVALLYLFSIFDRPCDEDAMYDLLQSPGVLTQLHSASDSDDATIRSTLSVLASLSLIEARQDGSRIFDTHPLIRSYFKDRFLLQFPEHWSRCNKFMGDYFLEVSGKNLDQPSTLSEMEPLFLAFHHRCNAGQHNDAYGGIFMARLYRDGEQRFLPRYLGAFGEDLALLTQLYSRPWARLVEGFPWKDQANIHSHTGQALKALGRISEAVKVFELGLKIHEDNDNFADAGRAAKNTAEAHLVLGNAEAALVLAERGVHYSEKVENDGFNREICRSVFAECLHTTGDIRKSLTEFRETELLQNYRLPSGAVYLVSLQGYRYCDLLLSMGLANEAYQRARSNLVHYSNCGFNISSLTLGLDELTIARAQAHIGQTRITLIEKQFDKACSLLFESGERWAIAVANLRYAEFLVLQKRVKVAERKLAIARAHIAGSEMTTCEMEYSLVAALALSTNIDLPSVPGLNNESWTKSDVRDLIDNAVTLISSRKLQRLFGLVVFAEGMSAHVRGDRVLWQSKVMELDDLIGQGWQGLCVYRSGLI